MRRRTRGDSGCLSPQVDGADPHDQGPSDRGPLEHELCPQQGYRQTTQGSHQNRRKGLVISPCRRVSYWSCGETGRSVALDNAIARLPYCNARATFPARRRAFQMARGFFPDTTRPTRSNMSACGSETATTRVRDSSQKWTRNSSQPGPHTPADSTGSFEAGVFYPRGRVLVRHSARAKRPSGGVSTRSCASPHKLGEVPRFDTRRGGVLRFSSLS